MWITPPAKVKKLGVIERIIASVYDAQGDLTNALTDSDLLLGTRQRFTPYGYQVLLIDNKLQALRQQQVIDEPNTSLTPPDSPDSNLLWNSVVNMYGTLRPGISYVTLEQPDGTDVTGTVAYDPTDDRFLLFDVDIDTTPQNTLDPIDAVINPLVTGPRPEDSVLQGVRYLLTEDTGSLDNPNPATDWVGANGRGLVAQANDIIEYSNNYWRVVFRASTETNNTQYVTNITTGIQYRWTGEAWVKSYQGVYPGGTWRIVL